MAQQLVLSERQIKIWFRKYHFFCTKSPRFRERCTNIAMTASFSQFTVVLNFRRNIRNICYLFCHILWQISWINERVFIAENRRMKAKKESKAKGIPYNPTGGSGQLMSSSCASYSDTMPHQHKCQAGSSGKGCGSQNGMPDTTEHYRTGSVIMANSNGYGNNPLTADGAVKRLSDLTDQLNGPDSATEYDNGTIAVKPGRNPKKRRQARTGRPERLCRWM